MTRSPRRRLRRAGAGVAVLAILACAGPPAPAVATPARAAAAPARAVTAAPARPAAASSAVAAPAKPAASPVTADLLTLSPQIVRPGEQVTVGARVANDGTGALTGATATLRTGGRVILTRNALESWASAGPTTRRGTSVAEAAVPTLAPGTHADVSFTVDAAKLGITASGDWGPRGIAVLVSAPTGAIAVVRAFVVEPPGDEVTPLGLSVAAAFTGPATDPLDAKRSRATMEAAVGATGRLGRLLAATAEAPEITWVMDPALLTAADADPATKPWANQVRGARPGRTVFELPAYDQDLAAYAHAPEIRLPATLPPSAAASPTPSGTGPTPSGNGPTSSATGPTTSANSSGATGPTRPDGRAPGAPRTDLAWPADAVPDRVTVDYAVTRRTGFVMITGKALTTGDDLTYTPTGLGAIRTPSGRATAVIADPVLSAALGAAGSAATYAANRAAGANPSGTGTATPGTGATRSAGSGTDASGTGASDAVTGSAGSDSGPAATTRLLAETAVIARERPAEARHLLVALGREWEPDPVAFTAALVALRAASWVKLESLEALLAAPVPVVSRKHLPASNRSPGRLDRAGLADLVRSRDSLAQFAGVAADPARITGPMEAGFLAPTAVAYRDAVAARGRAISRVAARVRTVRSTVTVVPGSTFNLISSSSELGVTVRNDLDQQVRVGVVLTDDDPRLKVMSTPTLTVPARSMNDVAVPVRAIGTGNVDVDVALTSPTGEVVATGESIRVRVRAGWESVGTGIIGAVLGLIVLGGLWRTVRRGRSAGRTADATGAIPTVVAPSAGGPSAGGPTGVPSTEALTAPPADGSP